MRHTTMRRSRDLDSVFKDRRRQERGDRSVIAAINDLKQKLSGMFSFFAVEYSQISRPGQHACSTSPCSRTYSRRTNYSLKFRRVLRGEWCRRWSNPTN